MVRIFSLVWTLMIALFTTGLSFFYIRGVTRGFPFSFAKEVTDSYGAGHLEINQFSIALDLLFWWLIFSVLWIVIKNYIIEV